MKKTLIDFLRTHKIEFESFEHPALFTCEDAKKLDSQLPGASCKNLFLTDGNRFFLLSMVAEKKLNIKEIQKQISSHRISFGKPEVLYEKLKITPGSVTPFALMNDTENCVEYLLDKKLLQAEKIGFHPLVNTETFVLLQKDLLRFLKTIGKTHKEVEL